MNIVLKMLIFNLESDFSPIEIKTTDHEDFVDYEVEFAELNDEHHARKNMIFEYLFCFIFLISKTFSQTFIRFRIVSICQEHILFLEVISSIIWADPFLQQVRLHYFVSVCIAHYTVQSAFE
jgi:hypothetical protein